MSRRLLNRSHAPASSVSSPANSRTPARSQPTSSLPEYEPLMCPLSENARRTLNELSNSRDAVPYENQLKDSIRQVSQCVGDLHERLRTRRDRLNDLRRRREEKGTEKSAEEERLEVHIPKLEKEVADLTRDSEHTVRQIVDWRTELEDEGAVFVDLYQNVASSNAINPGDRRGQRGPGENDESGPENDESVTSVLATYRELRTQKKRDYTKMSPYERYALNNDYVGFKKIWYDAAAGDDGPPLPDPTRWFLQNGEPDLNTPGADEQGPTPDDDNDDDDVAVSRENISINCPLTLLPMTEPYANRKCPHRFEKSAILEYLPARGMMQCPQTGCSQTFSRSNFERDFYLDENMLRKIQRAKAAERAQNDVEMDDYDEAGDESVVFGSKRHIRTGRAVKREQSSRQDDEEM